MIVEFRSALHLVSGYPSNKIEISKLFFLFFTYFMFTFILHLETNLLFIFTHVCNNDSTALETAWCELCILIRINNRNTNLDLDTNHDFDTNHDQLIRIMTSWYESWPVDTNRRPWFESQILIWIINLDINQGSNRKGGNLVQHSTIRIIDLDTNLKDLWFVSRLCFISIFDLIWFDLIWS